MATRMTTTPTQYRNDVFSALAHSRRRAVLRLLDELDSATHTELATHIVAAESDESIDDVSSDAAERAKRRLMHGHLPKLINAGLVTDIDGTVASTDHPALRDPTLTAMIEDDARDWDAVLSCLADERRRTVLSTLAGQNQPTDLADLAVAVADDSRVSDDAGDGQEPAVDDLRIELHHVHLPKLDDAGLVSYDADAETATFEGRPDLDEEWLESRHGPIAAQRDVRSEVTL